MKLHEVLFKSDYQTFEELEAEISKLSTTKDKGDAFEDFVFCFLSIRHVYYQVREVYRLQDAPGHVLKMISVETSDSGVDGIFIRNDDQIVSYQVKFRSDRSKPSYEELAKFWVESASSDMRFTIANCYEITSLAEKQTDHYKILMSDFEDLKDEFWDQFNLFKKTLKSERKYYKPYEFQENIISDVVEGFKSADRGKLIAACGTGKTLTALWISEKMNGDHVIFMTPSLALIKQTLNSWSEQTKRPFIYICVCSDESVVSGIEDYGDITISDLGTPVTTDPDDVVNFLSSSSDVVKIVFSTYQSIPVVADACESSPSLSFDIGFFDEAHRTAGAKYSEHYNMALNDDRIKISKRLFMTATERLLRPRLKEKAKELDRLIFSMDDEDVYGHTLHYLSFGKAIGLRIISDYRIIVAAIREAEIYDYIAHNTELQDDDEEFHAFAEVLFTQVLLAKAMDTYDISKTITFHSSIRNAKVFADGYGSNYDLATILHRFISRKDIQDLYINHINGSYSAGKRRQILDDFKNSSIGIITNSRCLTEGVDVPIIDSIYFVDPKNSLVDIVQACGRALRKPIGQKEKVSYIILPILIPEGIQEEELFNHEKFASIYSVVQSLRDQDERFAQWIDSMNQKVAGGKYTKPEWSPIDIVLPSGFSLEKFEQGLLTRIAIVNSESTKAMMEPRMSYGRTQRRSKFNRIFRTIGDYSVNSFRRNLVDPTLEKFSSHGDYLEMNTLKVNHNNVSHTLRVGLIEKYEKIYFKLTPLGKDYFSGQIDFETLFSNQILKYRVVKDSRILFPYRSLLKVLNNVGDINFLDFAYPLCSIYDSSLKSEEEVCEAILGFKSEIPDVNILNRKNKLGLLERLNSEYDLRYTEADIWAKKTTLNNQFIYFRNHLSLFHRLLDINSARIKLKTGCEVLLDDLLGIHSSIEEQASYEDYWKLFSSK